MSTKTASKSAVSPAYALQSINACGEAIRWASDFDNAQAAWDACERGDWMLWLLGKLSGPPGSASRKKVVLAACACARLALPQYEIRYPDDRRPRAAIETAESHANGGASLKEVRDAYVADAAYAAYVAAYVADAADAADAAYAAYVAAYAAYVADAAADAAAYAADAAAADARTKRLAECARIVRKHFPKAPKITKGQP